MRWAILDALAPGQQRDVLSNARRRKFGRNEIVFHEGDPGDTLHLIERGRVAVRVATPLGDSVTLRLVGPGEYFGELSLLTPGPRNATVTALEPTETLSLSRDHLTRLRDRYPALDRILLETIVDEVRRLSSALLDAMYVPVPTRLARLLVRLADIYGVPGADTITIPLTQDDLAGLCGTTRPTVNQLLNRLADEGAVFLNRGKVGISNLANIQRRAK
jgi:CRP-like cAMP-binding protein